MPVKILEKEVLEESSKLIELEKIKAIAFKEQEDNKSRNLDKERYSCGWSVCHCATYGM